MKQQSQVNLVKEEFAEETHHTLFALPNNLIKHTALNCLCILQTVPGHVTQ